VRRAHVHTVARHGALVAAVVGLFVAFAAFWATGTKDGAAWSFERLGALVPGKLKVGTLDGPLRGPLVVHDVSYASDQVEITADRVAIDWRLDRLFGKRLDIRSLAAHNVKMTFHFRDVMPDTTILPDVDLPVAILVRQAKIDSLTIYGFSLPPDTALTIDHVTLASTEFRDTLGIQELALRSPRLDATFVGTLLPRGDYPLDMHVRWRWQSPRGIDVAGGGTFRGTLAHLDVDQTIDSPFAAHLVGRQTHATRFGRFVGEATVRGLRATDFVVAAPAGIWSGHANVDGVPLRFAAAGELEGTGTQLGRVLAQGRIQRDSTRWAFADVLVRRPVADTRIAGSGTVDVRPVGPALVDARAEWRNLAWPIEGRTQVLSREGKATVRGSLGGYDVRAEGAVADLNENSTRFTLAGRGDSNHVALSDVRATALRGSVHGKGVVTWRPSVRWDLALAGEQLDPAARWPGWDGALDVALVTRGTYAGTARGTVEVSRIGGTLRGRPVTGHAALAFAGTSGRIDTLALAVEDATIGAKGAFGGPWDLAWGLDAPRLGVLAPGGAGVVHARGPITGSRTEPRLIAHVEADTGAVSELRVTRLVGDADVGTTRNGAVTVDLHADGLAYGARHADSLAVTARGTGGSHTADLVLTSATEQWKSALTGGFAGGDWRGSLNTLDLVSQRVGNWGLTGPAQLAGSLRDGTAQVDALCWRSGGSSLCGSGAYRGGQAWEAHAKLDSLRLALVAPLIVREQQLEGRMDGTIDLVSDRAGALTGTAHLLPGPGQVRFLGATTPDSVSFDRGTLDLTIGPAGLDLKSALTFAGTDHVEGTLALPGWRRLGQPGRGQAVRGTLVAHARDLRIAQALFTDLADTRGALDADLALAGTLGSPSLSGRVDVDSARAVVPNLGIELVDIQLAMTGEGGRHLAVKGGMTSGGGRVAIDGSASLTDDGTPTANLTLKGERFLAANRPDLRIVASPDLAAKLEGDHATATGTLTVPEANVKLAGSKPVVRPSLDIRFVTANPDSIPTRPGLQIDGGVRVVLGDAVHIEGQGMSGRTTGQVMVTQVAGGATRGSGELALEEGTYDAYGQTFAIERGRLLYAGGPVQNPGLDLRATRKAGTVTAGFEVRGTLENPRLTVVSDPAMSENEALAYAITGRPLENISVGQSEAVATAASSFALQQGNALASNVAKSLGLKEARIQSGATFQQTELFLGTQLTRNLYLGYGLGLFEGTNVFRLRYLLNSSFTLEAESAKENRASLLFTREH
jgi:translocation and assembly module TamB